MPATTRLGEGRAWRIERDGLESVDVNIVGKCLQKSGVVRRAAGERSDMTGGVLEFLKLVKSHLWPAQLVAGTVEPEFEGPFCALWILRSWALLAAFFFTASASAYPVHIPVEGALNLAGGSPAAVVAFASPVSGKGEPGKGALDARPVPHQVLARSRRGDLLFRGQSVPKIDEPLLEKTGGVLPPRARPQREVALEPQDLIVVDSNDFSPCDSGCEDAVARAARDMCGRGVELYRASLGPGSAPGPLPRRNLYLASCTIAGATIANDAWRHGRDPDVRLSLARRTLSSDSLSYTYSEKNHMLLERFSLKRNDGKETPLLVGSELHLYGKPRFFFPLHFTGDDVRSELLAYLQDPLGTSGRLSFFLDVLFFRVKLDLRSAVTIYRDAVHVPVVMTLPVSGTSLREGSGMYYGFNAADGEVLEGMRTTMRRLCRGPVVGEQPVPTFFVEKDGSCVAVGVREPPEFGAMGFHPQIAFPSDLQAIGFPKVGTDFGVFYDITKLRKGRYSFDVWFYVASGGSCAGLENIAREGFTPMVEIVEMRGRAQP